MSYYFENLAMMIESPLGKLEVIAIIVISLCVFVIFTSILINFVEAKNRGKPKKEKKSIVETGTMTLFFMILYIVIRFRIGVIEYNDVIVRGIIIIISLIVMIIGCGVNVVGRLKLGKNWANQVKIYKDHTLVKTGVYGIVRHPLYASLIWMFYAATLIYLNYTAFLLITLIFVPFMYYRAKQEEKFLTERFKEYKEYQKDVGMFVPKWKSIVHYKES